MPRGIAQFLVNWRWPLLVVGLLLGVVAAFASGGLEFDRSIENMFAADDPLLHPYRRLKRIFGGNEIALAAYSDPELLTPEGLDRLEQLTARLEEVPGVESAFSLARVRRLASSHQFLELSEGYTIGPDRTTAGIVCVLDPGQGSRQRTATVDALRQIVESRAGGVLAGEPVMVVDGFRYIEADGRLLGAAATALLMLTILACFRSLRWAAVPMVVVVVTLMWTEALLVAANVRLSMVSSMLWAIVTVIGIATVVHLIVRFREHRSGGLVPREALVESGAALAAPIFWACLTDAAGFASLLVSRVGPVHDFGLMMVAGSLLVLPAMALVVPGLALGGRLDPDPRRAWGERNLDAGLSRTVRAVERRPRFLAALALVASIACSLGIAWLEVETDFTRNFRRSSPVVRSYEFIESRLGGAGVWDIIVPVPNNAGAGWLKRLRDFERRLRDEVTVRDVDGQEVPGLTKVLSAADAIEVLERLPLGRAFRLMPLSLERKLELLGRRVPLVDALHGRDPLDPDRLYLRVMLRARERQPSGEKQRLIAQVRRITREEFPQAEVTGFFVLLTRLIESIAGDQWLTFGLATAGIGLMMLLAFRSLPLALIALVPNALPILMVLGLMGWLGVRVNMGAAMIAAVSMGLAVDSSIHYITAFVHRRGQGDSVGQALEAVHQQVGRAMVFSSLALVVGFSALVLSRFVPTIYFGVLVSLAMFGGLVGNLVVLPLLLSLQSARQ